MFTTTLTSQLRSSPESRLSEGDPHGSPAAVPTTASDDVCGAPSRSEWPFTHFAGPATVLPEHRTTATPGFETG